MPHEVIPFLAVGWREPSKDVLVAWDARMENYLNRLPPKLRLPGDCQHGEIELLASGGVDASQAFGIIYEDAYIMLVRDQVRFPSGKLGAYIRIVEKGELEGQSGTVMLPIVENQVASVHIFRHATRTWEWELIRGFQEPGMSDVENAVRETKEELGVEPESVERIGSIKPNTGLLSGEASVFLVRLPQEALHNAHGESEEGIRQIQFVACDKLDLFLLENVTCGFSLSAVLLARLHHKIP